jgi:hypothetical protein
MVDSTAKGLSRSHDHYPFAATTRERSGFWRSRPKRRLWVSLVAKNSLRCRRAGSWESLECLPAASIVSPLSLELDTCFLSAPGRTKSQAIIRKPKTGGRPRVVQPSMFQHLEFLALDKNTGQENSWRTSSRWPNGFCAAKGDFYSRACFGR